MIPRERLAATLKLRKIELLPHSYDVIGDIAVLRVSDMIENRGREVAEAVMQNNKHVKTVLRQVSPVSSSLRLRALSWVAGEKRTETVHKEHGCLFKVDVARCYFSPRLLYERRRIAQQVGPDEVVVNLFSGVGSYSVMIARHSGARRVYSIDVNPVAIEYQAENVRLNGVESVVEVILGDAASIVKARLLNIADRVLMPLPEKAFEYLDYAIMALRPGEGWVHYYDSVRASRDEKPVEKVEDKVSRKMADLGLDFEVSFGRVVRKVGPRRFQVVLDMLVRKESL